MIKGATFKRADLHLHTPGQGQNFRAGMELNTDAQRRAFAEAYVQRALDVGLEIIAITNHNSTAYIDLIRQAAQDTALTVFPGVAIFITVLGFNFIGDGLREALDPRLRQMYQ